jgi:hypothetical protein
VQVERHLLTDVKVLAARRVGFRRGDSAARGGSSGHAGSGG